MPFIPYLNNNFIQSVKSAGGVLYLDARKATGSGLPSNSPLTNPFVDLSGIQSSYNFVNILGTDGNFQTDSNSDGLGDGWSSFNITNKSMASNEQSFTATSQFGGITKNNINAVIGNVYYLCGFIKASTNTVELGVTDSPGSASTFHSGSGNYEFLSLNYTKDASDSVINNIHVSDDKSTSGWQQVKAKQLHLINLTAMFGAGNEPIKAYMDWLTQKTIAQYGYINTLTLQLTNNALLTNFGSTTSSGYDTSDSLRPYVAFDGLDDAMSLVNTASLDITNAPLAVFATIKIPTLATGYVFCKNVDSATNVQYALVMNSNGSITVYLEGSARITTNPNDVLVNTAYNIGLIWDGTNLKVYKNGTLLGSIAYSGTLTSRSNVRIGCRGNTSNTNAVFFKGNIATLTIYSGIKANEQNILKSEKSLSKVYIGG